MENVLNTFEKTVDSFTELLAGFSPEEINKRPMEGSWTAGEVAQHLIKGGSGLSQVVNGPSRPTERQPDELADKIKSTFLNFDTKFNAPAFTVPEEVSYDKDALLQAFAGIKADISKAIKTLDLTQTSTGYKLPVYGEVTRLEIIAFITYHIQRHTHQLKNIYQTIKQ